MDVNQAAVTVLEQIPVAPPPEETAGISLPFTFLDVFWLHMAPVHRLIFYHHPISKAHFLDTLIPKIKNSLSFTLQHYSPLAGRVIISPDDSRLPEIRYMDGDTVPLVIAECNSSEGHFGHLTSDHARNCSDFHPLVPILPPTTRAPDGSVIIPVLALQVTLFPDVGICIGVTNHHAIGDGSSIFAFMKSWAFFSSHEITPISPVSLPDEFQPFYDRTAIKDPKGLGKLVWDHMKNIKIEDTQVHRLSSITNKVRATFAVTRHDIQRLKSHALNQRPDLLHVTSFTMVCSYVWNCLVTSRNETNIDDDNNNNDDEDYDYFTCPADYRSRLDPPVPKNYFGNCVMGCIAKAKTKRLTGEKGFLEAAFVVGEGIHTQVDNNKEDYEVMFKDIGEKFAEFAKIKPGYSLGVASSPRFDYYQLDFGWGKPKKFEVPSIDLTGAMSLGTSKNYEGGLEVGLSLPITQMNTFISVFTQGLKAL